MAKYVKLGSKASIFYDPTTNTKVLPGQIVEVKGIGKFSKKINAALKGGHLENVSKEDFEKFQKGGTVNNDEDINTGNWVEQWDDFDEKSLKGLKNDQLAKLATHLESEFSEQELGQMKKAELIEEILSLVEEE